MEPTKEMLAGTSKPVKLNQGSSWRRERALKALNEASVSGLDEIFAAKLAAIRHCEKTMAGISDPYARKAILTMVRQERDQLNNLAELIDIVEQAPHMGQITYTKRRINHQLKANSGKGLGFWLGTAALSMFLLPVAKEGFRPVVDRAIQGIMNLSEQAQGLVATTREDLESAVREMNLDKSGEYLADIVTATEEPTRTDRPLS